MALLQAFGHILLDSIKLEEIPLNLLSNVPSGRRDEQHQMNKLISFILTTKRGVPSIKLVSWNENNYASSAFQHIFVIVLGAVFLCWFSF